MVDNSRTRKTYSFMRARPKSTNGVDMSRYKKTYSFLGTSSLPKPIDPVISEPIPVSTAIQYHDSTFSPVLLCQFNESLSDSSGNNLDLSIDAGSVEYVDLYEIKALRFNSLRLTHVADPLLAIADDMTIEMIVTLNEQPDLYPALGPFINYSGGIDDGAPSAIYNYLYYFNIYDGLQALWYQEYGVNFASTVSSAGSVVEVGELFHFAATRVSNVVTLYVNGVAVASNSVVQATGGSAAQLYVGGTGGLGGSIERFVSDCTIASLKIVASGLSADDIKSEYNRTVGPRLGLLP